MIEERESRTSKAGKSIPERAARPSLVQLLEATPNRYLLLFTAIYFLAQYCANRHRIFWIDELFTYNLANLPSIGEIWPLIKQGIELNPPLVFWLTWIIHHTLGRGGFLTRLPAITGFWLMCICLYHYVRRRSDTAHGFIALLLPLFTYTSGDATWARSYGLLLGFSAAALLSWQFAIDNVRRNVAIPALALSLAAAVSSHYYAVYSSCAILAGELIRTWMRRKIDIPVLASIVLGTGTLAFYIPLLKAVEAGSKTFWIAPQIRFLYGSYADLFGPAAMIFLLFMILVIRVPETQADWTPRRLHIHETATVLLFAAMPFVIFVAAMFTRAAFYNRYVQPVVIGFSIAVALFAYRVCGNNQSYRRIAVGLVVWLCFVPWTLWHVLSVMAPEPWTVVQRELCLPHKNSSLPIVIDNDSEFMTAYHYAPQKMRDRFYFLTDRASALKYLGSNTGEHSLILAQTFHDFHIVSYNDFVRRFPRFLVARPKAGGWVLQRLLQNGADVRLIELEKRHGVFVQDHQLFEVKIGAQKVEPEASQSKPSKALHRGILSENGQS